LKYRSYPEKLNCTIISDFAFWCFNLILHDHRRSSFHQSEAKVTHFNPFFPAMPSAFSPLI
jgi:hypothetical protein